MKSYFILDCPQQQKIADSLYGYYVGITAHNKPKGFWNTLTREQIKDYFSIPNNPTKNWFDNLGLKVRDMSYTIYNEEIWTDIHKDEPPVVAKINFPVLNTKDTFNVWFDDYANESRPWCPSLLSCSTKPCLPQTVRLDRLFSPSHGNCLSVPQSAK